jgi:carboxymethylenebutenolidase
MSDGLRETTFRTAGGAIPGLLALPAILPAPAIAVIPAIYGIDDEMETVVRDFAARGFIAFVDNPFWRDREPEAIPFAEGERARARNKRFNPADGVGDLAAIAAGLRRMPECDGRYAVVGYCFGGRYAFLAAARFGAAAAVAYHGTRIQEHLDEAPNVACPVSFHYGDHDTATPLAEIARIEAALADNSQAEICVYPGAGHDFTKSRSAHYDAGVTRRAAERAWRILGPLVAARV